MGRFFGRVYPPGCQKQQPGSDEKQIREFLTTVRLPQGNPESHYLLAKFYQERGKLARPSQNLRRSFISIRDISRPITAWAYPTIYRAIS